MEKLVEWLDRRLSRIETKVDDLSSKQAEMNVVLEEHQRRSLANEQAVELLREEVKPLTAATAMWAVFAKVVAVVGGLVSTIYAVMKLLEAF